MIEAGTDLSGNTDPWRSMQAQEGFNPATLLTQTWRSKQGPRAIQQRFAAEGHPWPCLITGVLRPNLPRALVWLLDEVLTKDSGDSSPSRRSIGSHREERARWILNMLYLHHRAEDQLGRKPTPLTQLQIIEHWGRYSDFISDDADIEPPEHITPSNASAVGRVMKLVLERIGEKIEKGEAMKRYAALVRGGGFAQRLKRFSDVKDPDEQSKQPYPHEVQRGPEHDRQLCGDWKSDERNRVSDDEESLSDTTWDDDESFG